MKKLILGAMAAVMTAGGAWVGCAEPVRARPEVESRQEAWTFRGVAGKELISAHYCVRTTCTNPRLLHDIPEFLETCWSAYSDLVPPKRDPASAAMTYLFQTRQQWEIFTREFSPAKAPTYLLIRSGGYEERGVTVSHYGRMVTTLSVLSHEGLHQFLSLTRGSPLPAWANEGLACYFEAFDLDDQGRPKFTPRNNLIRRNSLRDAYFRKDLFALPELLSTNAGRVVSLPTMKVRTYYGQTWSIVLMLLEADPKSKEGAGFRRLLADLGTEDMRRVAAEAAGKDVRGEEFGERVFRAYVTDDLDGFQTRYEAYVKRLLGLS